VSPGDGRPLVCVPTHIPSSAVVLLSRSAVCCGGTPPLTPPGRPHRAGFSAGLGGLTDVTVTTIHRGIGMSIKQNPRRWTAGVPDAVLSFVWLEPETKAGRGSEVILEQIAARQTIRDSRIHHAGVEVELLGKLPIDVERNRVQLARARRFRCIGAECLAEAVLIVVVVRDAGIDSGGEGVSRAGPRDLQMLVVGIHGLGDIAEQYTDPGDVGKARPLRVW
jgi:hypothetical protein